MKEADAPPAGWYPDPTWRDRLRWWNGLDWTDHRRPPLPKLPPGAEDHAFTDASSAGAGGVGAAAAGLDQAAEAVRRRAPAAARGRDQTAEMMAEVRRVARDEVERAANTITQRATDATRRIQPMVTQYGEQVLRWIRNAGIAIFLLVALWLVLQVTIQTSLLEWLGDRIDNLTSGVVNVIPVSTRPG